MTHSAFFRKSLQLILVLLGSTITVQALGQEHPRGRVERDTARRVEETRQKAETDRAATRVNEVGKQRDLTARAEKNAADAKALEAKTAARQEARQREAAQQAAQREAAKQATLAEGRRLRENQVSDAQKADSSSKSATQTPNSNQSSGSRDGLARTPSR